MVAFLAHFLFSVVPDTVRLPTAITKQHKARIRVGMTQRQVEALLGGPPGDYTFRLDVGRARTPPRALDRGALESTLSVGETIREWVSDRCGILVIFDQNLRVSGARYYTLEDCPVRTGWEALRALARRWHSGP
jgi:hypothetical protein